jgi:hypothetical protein
MKTLIRLGFRLQRCTVQSVRSVFSVILWGGRKEWAILGLETMNVSRQKSSGAARPTEADRVWRTGDRRKGIQARDRISRFLRCTPDSPCASVDRVPSDAHLQNSCFLFWHSPFGLIPWPILHALRDDWISILIMAPWTWLFGNLARMDATRLLKHTCNSLAKPISCAFLGLETLGRRL